MVPGHEHYRYSPCGNKPAYRESLRKEIEIMIDAGAPVVHIDEFDAPLLAAMSGGCFCNDCMKQFPEYLKQNPSAETEGLDLDRFDYRGTRARLLAQEDREAGAGDGQSVQLRSAWNGRAQALRY